jgi:hypothetical protein
LKPNDLGLFDMLGNADEICQGSLRAGPGMQAAVCGGSVAYKESSIRCGLHRGPMPVVIQSLPGAWAFGFRVARTITPARIHPHGGRPESKLLVDLLP